MDWMNTAEEVAYFHCLQVLQKMKFFIVFAAVFWVILQVAIAQHPIYGTIPEEDYLVGRFDPSKHTDLFILITSIPTGYPMYLRRDAFDAFEHMYRDMLIENPTLPTNLLIVSSTRNQTSQTAIWNGKWNGEYAHIPNPLLRGLEILQFSSMPGTSRHHWGTDIDFFSLNNSDFDTGNGKIIYTWMTQNAYKYGFCQPYTAGRCAGYQEERWHWSFSPISGFLRRQWNRAFGEVSSCKLLGKVDFQGAKYLVPLAASYVNTINDKCP